MNSSHALKLLAVAMCTISVRAQQVIGTATGSTGSAFGTAAIRVPDQNGDGFDDVLVGAPLFNNTGAVYCISGASLATGGGGTVLWSLVGSFLNSGAAFGTSIAMVGNLSGDAAPDFVVGAPNYRPVGSSITTGAVFLIDGTTHTSTGKINGYQDTHLGTAVVGIGDRDHDGKPDIAVTAPAVSSSVVSNVHVIPGSSWFGVPGLSLLPHWSKSGPNGFGTALASGFDLDGDGVFDLAIGSPLANFSTSVECGFMLVVSTDSSFTLLGAYLPAVPGEHLGQSVDAVHDYNGDGVVDFVVGAPNAIAGVSAQVGRVVVVSGAKMRAFISPMELYVWSGASGITPTTTHFGATVRACSDLNHDGVGDVLVGMPDFHTVIPAGPNKGGVAVYSGATGAKIGGVVGAINDRLGDALVGTMGDLDGDGYSEFAFAGSLSDNPTTDCGTLQCARLFPCFPTTYCTGKVNSLGCTPVMTSNSNASASVAAPFIVSCVSLINQKSGVLFYSHQPLAMPFQGGFLCVRGPSIRLAQPTSGGSATGADCTGAYSFDFNARIQSGIDPSLVAGAEVFCQVQSRDQQSPTGTSLSNALRFLINP